MLLSRKNALQDRKASGLKNTRVKNKSLVEDGGGEQLSYKYLLGNHHRCILEWRLANCIFKKNDFVEVHKICEEN